MSRKVVDDVFSAKTIAKAKGGKVNTAPSADATRAALAARGLLPDDEPPGAGIFAKPVERDTGGSERGESGEVSHEGNANHFLTEYMDTMIKIQEKQLEFTVWTNLHAKGDLSASTWQSLSAPEEPAGGFQSMSASDVEMIGAFQSMGASDEPAGDELRRTTEAEFASRQMALKDLISLAKELKESYESAQRT